MAGGAPALVKRNLYGDALALLSQLGLLIFVVMVWVIALPQFSGAGLFVPHPLLQSASIALFVQGILVLQPTHTPEGKRTGLALHQTFQLVGLVGILVGASFIWYNKHLHDAPHYASWHGKLGLLTVLWIIGQSFVGAVVVYPAGQKLFGGEGRAKALWKYHRASGYVLVTLMLLTAFTATSSADWVLQNSSYQERAAIGVGLACVLTGIYGRVNLGKMRFFATRRSG